MATEPLHGHDILRTKRLEVVDDHDRVRVVIGDVSSLDSMPGVSIRDANGHERAMLAIHKAGVSLTFVQEGNEVLLAGVYDDVTRNESPGAYLVMCDRDGSPVRDWRA